LDSFVIFTWDPRIFFDLTYVVRSLRFSLPFPFFGPLDDVSRDPAWFQFLYLICPSFVTLALEEPIKLLGSYNFNDGL